MKKHSFKQKFRYWFDNVMSKGVGSMIKILVGATAVFVVLVAALVALFSLSEDGSFFSALWDSFASTINAWVLYSGDGSVGYLVVMSLAAIFGLFLTSLLIGIISTGIEERLTALRKGNSLVLERGHTVLLGFRAGSYKLLSELCMAAEGGRRCIVVASGLDKEELETHIHENIELPRGVRLICRSVNICDPSELACCAIPDSRSVIIDADDDTDTVKALLAVHSVLHGNKDAKTRVFATIRGDEALIPARAALPRADVLHTGDVVARMIARTCTQPGIASVFDDLFGFSGDELYIIPLPSRRNKTFGEAQLAYANATLFGIVREGAPMLNPPPDTPLLPSDRLLVMTLHASSAREISGEPVVDESAFSTVRERGEPEDDLLVIGRSEEFDTVAHNLVGVVRSIKLAGVAERYKQEKRSLAHRRDMPPITVSDADIEDTAELEKLLRSCGHAVILADSDCGKDEADGEVLMWLLRLREIRDRNGMSFTITSEMNLEENKRLAERDDCSDFVISSDISAMLLSQVSENPLLISVFDELLSGHGSELYLRRADMYVKEAPVNRATLIAAARQRGCLFVGYRRLLPDGGYEIVTNPSPDATVTLNRADSLIVIDDM